MEEKERRETSKILAEGGNPYEVFRRRRLQSKADATRSELKQKVAESEMVIAQRMLDFAEYSRRKEEEEGRHEAMERSYRKSLGRHVQEQRVREILVSKTIGNVDSIDPSGRSFRVEPSQVTVIKPHGFGLGGVSEGRGDIVDMVAAKPQNRGVKPDPRFVPKARAPPADLPRADGAGGGGGGALGGEAEARALLGPTDAAAPPGAALAAMNLGPNGGGGGSGGSGEAAGGRPEDEGSEAVSAHGGASGTKRFPPPQRSVLEERLLREARERHTRDIVQEQVVWGRTFTGEAFLAKPERVVFKDFVVGETFYHSFTLTNVSFSFNQFKLLDLRDNVKNFFEIALAHLLLNIAPLRRYFIRTRFKTHEI